jgi:flavin-binding protein dodecin
VEELARGPRALSTGRGAWHPRALRKSRARARGATPRPPPTISNIPIFGYEWESRACCPYEAQGFAGEEREQADNCKWESSSTALGQRLAPSPRVPHPRGGGAPGRRRAEAHRRAKPRLVHVKITVFVARYRPAACAVASTRGTDGTWGRRPGSSNTRPGRAGPLAADHGRRAIAVAHVVEISATSPQGFEDALRQGLERANRTLRGVTSAWIKEQRVKLQDGRIREYQVDIQVTFVLEG